MGIVNIKIFFMKPRLIGYAWMSILRVLRTSGSLSMPLCLFSFREPIACDKALGNMVRWFNSVVFGIVATPSNGIFLLRPQPICLTNFLTVYSYVQFLVGVHSAVLLLLLPRFVHV